MASKPLNENHDPSRPAPESFPQRHFRGSQTDPRAGCLQGTTLVRWWRFAVQAAGVTDHSFCSRNNYIIVFNVLFSYGTFIASYAWTIRLQPSET